MQWKYKIKEATKPSSTTGILSPQRRELDYAVDNARVVIPELRKCLNDQDEVVGFVHRSRCFSRHAKTKAGLG